MGTWHLWNDTDRRKPKYNTGRKPCINPRHMTRPAVPVAARSKAWVCGRSLAGIAGSNAAGRHGCLSPVSVVCCQAEGSATG